MRDLSASLLAHQQGRARKPAVLVASLRARGGVELLSWTRYYAGVEADAPQASCLAGDGSLVRVRNAAGTVYGSRVASPGSGSTYSSWSAVTSLVSGGTLALAAKTGEVTLVTANGTYLDVRHSSDNGATWGSSTTRATAAAAITSCAVAYNAAGDLVVFFTVTSSTNVYRLRRAGGTWDGSATAWTRSSSVASLTGVAACYDGADFQLLVTGTAVTTAHKRTWSLLFGDGVLFTLNAWSGLFEVAASDSGSTTTFGSPAIGFVAANGAHGFFKHAESAAPAYSRTMYSHGAPGPGATDTWVEPSPHEAVSAYGVGFISTETCAWLTTANGVWYGAFLATADLSSRVVSCSWRLGPEGGKCRVELDNQDGGLSGPVAGQTLEVAPGYASDVGGAPEYGVLFNFTIDRVLRRVENGRATVHVEASTVWEQLAEWHAPQAWQSAAGALARWQLATRIARRAGFAFYSGSSPWQESAAWLETPAFALGPGENGAAALKRLLAPTADFVRPASDGLGLAGLTRWRNVVLGMAPAGYWRQGAAPGATSIPDETTYANAATVAGAVVLGQRGCQLDDPVTGALMDGDTARISVTTGSWDYAGTAAFSLVLLVRFTPHPGGYKRIISKESTAGGLGDQGWDIMRYPDGAAVFHRWLDDGRELVSSSPLADYTTLLLVATYDGTTMRLYVNGAQVDSVASSRSLKATAANMSFGAFPVGSGDGAAGVYGDVAVFSRALSASEVTALQAARTASDYSYSAASHAPSAVRLASDLPAKNWFRVQGAGKYADAVRSAAAYGGGPQLAVLKDPVATTDAAVQASAGNALRRAVVEDQAGELVAAFNAGQELFDLVTVTEPKVGLAAARYRVIGLGMEYHRGPKAGRYDSVLSLGNLK